MGVLKFSCVDFVFTCVGLVFLLLDIVLDVLAAFSFYWEQAYVSLGVLLLFLMGSSVLVQAFSWLWYSHDGFERKIKVESCMSLRQLIVLHLFQLGIYFRHAGVVEASVCGYFKHTDDLKNYAVYLSHDLNMLRLIEAFSESAPQLVLMLTIVLQRGELNPVTVLKAVASASAIAFSVTMYHRSLRSFLLDKEKQPLLSSVVYFFWNQLLIMSRLTALALFTSVLPCFIPTHFICSWMVLFFFAWRSKTDLMDSAVGEWLYRATVGLIWYFSWFNVVEGRTRYTTLLYHGYILVDMSILCSLWCWKIITEPPSYLEIQPLYAVITAVGVVAVYIIGLLVKTIYYKCFHPNLGKEKLKGDVTEQSRTGPGPSTNKLHLCTVDGNQDKFLNGEMETDVTDRMWPSPSEDIERALPPLERSTECYNKRMRKLAANFYS